MALIANGKPGREDGGYTRVLGNSRLGALISQIHGTSISAGSKLEKIISDFVIPLTADQLGQLESGKLKSGTHLLTKDVIQKHLKEIIGTQFEPDFIVIVMAEARVLVVELKDGDVFDTKKASGEVELLRTFAQKLHTHLLQTALSNYAVEIKLCSFNQADKDAIVEGMKKRIKKSEAMTGAEFCKLVGAPYKTIRNARKTDEDANFSYFLDKLVEIPEVREGLESRLGIIKDASQIK